VTHCLECHGETKQQGGLRLDSSDGLKKGGDAGPVLDLDNLGGSRLIEVLSYESDMKMPPAGKLSDTDRTVLENWIRGGAYFPASTSPVPMPVAPTSREGIESARASHWSLQPVIDEPIDVTGPPEWTTSPIDRHVMSRLQASGLSPSPAADRRTLIRRLTFDLIGLPPTAAEVAAFEADGSPDAVEKLVDRLLASPHYGERWARLWLDVARYADTKGYVFNQERRFPYSYTYRDYVISAFNDDLPYNRFVLEQLAADKLVAPGADNKPLAALGFLTIGRRFSNNTHDIIDDRIDVVTRGLLGLTVTCARCHDHKYDPIPTADYYGLYGVFASCNEPAEAPVLGTPAETEESEKFLAELNARRKKLEDFETAERNKLMQEFRGKVSEYLQWVAIKPMMDDGGEAFELVFLPGELRPGLRDRWEKYLKRREERPDAIFGLWHQFARLPGRDFGDAAEAILESLRQPSVEASPAVNERIKTAILATPPKSMLDVAKIYGSVLNECYVASQPTEPDGAMPPPRDAADEQLREVLYGERSPTTLRPDAARRFYARDVTAELGRLGVEIEAWKLTSPGSLPRPMLLVDNDAPSEPVILIRGNPDRPGAQVPRRTPQVIAGPDSQPFQKGSGRLELAEAIVDPKNPLTARVFVNRVWMHHFGTGLVRTPSDFGVRGDVPVHRQLLDHLAAEFMRDGWSIKRLHRRIVLSATYRQSSEFRSDAAAVDPENRLFWRMNPRRLDFEQYRDALLFASGNLNLTIGGKSESIVTEPFSKRRTLYAYVDRQDLPGVFRTFDFPSPDASAPQRPQTTIPQQQLFGMNSKFVEEQAARVASRDEVKSATEPAGRIQAVYRAVLSRDPTPAETEQGTQFLQAAAEELDGQVSPLELFSQALLQTNEFVFVD
jgi:hypothetical protein